MLYASFIRIGFGRWQIVCSDLKVALGRRTPAAEVQDSACCVDLMPTRGS